MIAQTPSEKRYIKALNKEFHTKVPISERGIPKASKENVKLIDNLRKKTHSYQLYSLLLLGRSYHPFTEEEKKKFRRVLRDYNEKFSKHYPKIKEKERELCRRLRKAIGNKFKMLLEKTEGYVRIPFKDRKIVIHIPLFFRTGGMGFQRENKERICLCERSITRKKYSSFLLLHESLHVITNILSYRSSNLSEIIQRRYEEGKIFQNLSKFHKTDYRDGATIFNESLTRAVNRRMMVLDGFNEGKLLKEGKLNFGVARPLYFALKEDYEKDPEKYYNIGDFGLRWIEKNLL